MTSLERPLPLSVVVIALGALSVAGFTLGLRGALKDGAISRTASTQPLAEVSGLPVRDATPFIVPPAPPPVEKPKAKEPDPIAVVETEAPPIIEAPPAAPPEKTEPVPAQPQPPRNIEDLY